MANVIKFTDTLINEVGIEKAIEIICKMSNEEINSLKRYGE